MTTFVHFRTAGGRFCIPVGSTLGVRPVAGLVPLPAPRDGVVGILPAEQPITVLSVLGAGHDQVLVLSAHDQTFGLLVEEVTGLTTIDAQSIEAAPDGQHQAFIAGVLTDADGLVLVADADALAGRL
jgi:chemotaxis signal transduction protein